MANRQPGAGVMLHDMFLAEWEWETTPPTFLGQIIFHILFATNPSFDALPDLFKGIPI